MEVKRGEPISVLQTVLELLERQAIKAGSHPVMVHEAMEALDKFREENARLVAAHQESIKTRAELGEENAALRQRVEELEETLVRQLREGKKRLAKVVEVFRVEHEPWCDGGVCSICDLLGGDEGE